MSVRRPGFNEAGATIAPEMIMVEIRERVTRNASMRPGQQSPRKSPGRPGLPCLRTRFNEAGATIAPEIASARPLQVLSPCFNEAGATIAPEIAPHGQRGEEPAPGFNEAGATIAPEIETGRSRDWGTG